MKKSTWLILGILAIAIAIYFYLKKVDKQLNGDGIIKQPKNPLQDKWDSDNKIYGGLKPDFIPSKQTMRKYNYAKLPSELKGIAIKAPKGFDYNLFYENWLIKNGYGDNLKMFTDSF